MPTDSPAFTIAPDGDTLAFRRRGDGAPAMQIHNGLLSTEQPTTQTEC